MRPLNSLFLLLSLLLLSLLVPAPQSAGAATLTVTNNDRFGPGSLVDCIDIAAAGDTITFANNVTSPISIYNEEILITKNLTITGPTAGIVLQRDPNGEYLHRLFNIGSGATVSMTNLTIKNGQVFPGIAGSGDPAHPDGNPGWISQGGGILNNGTLTLRNCTLSGNTAEGGRGGDSVFIDCDGNAVGSNVPEFFGTGGTGGAGQGGGIFNGNKLTLINCTLSGNSAIGGAGGTGANIGVGGSGSGGGIYNQGTLTLTKCTFSGNVAKGGKAITTNSAYYNVARGGSGSGGGIYTQGTLTLTNDTLSGNAAVGADAVEQDGGDANGGGLFATGSAKPTVKNTLIAKNTVTGGIGRPAGTSINPDVSGAVTSTGYNLIGDGTGSSGFIGAGDRVGTSAAPLDPKLGPLQNNGGLTLTMMLLAGSPAIDQGTSGTTTDQRGYARPIDQAAIANAGAGNGSDIGSVEVGLTQSGTTLTVTNTDEHNDGVCSADDCTLLEALNVANANADANTINFKAGLSGVILHTGAAAGLELKYPVTISGLGARVLTISGNNTKRVFNVPVGGSATLSGLTISNGNSLSVGTGIGGSSGGGLFNAGTLTLLNCAVLNNSGGSGGGLASHGTLTLTNCTFAGNTSTGHGGAVRIASNTVSAVANLNNCTFSGNSAASSGGITASGTTTLPATVTLRSCTLSGNSATTNGNGGGLANMGSCTFNVGNTLVVGNSAATNPEAVGAFTSQGYNRIGSIGTATGFSGTGDLTGVTAAQINLGLLANNGGQTDTRALLSGSVAIDKGKNIGALTSDQRGQARLIDFSTIANASGGDGTDIGAFEMQPALSINDVSALEGNSGSSTLTFTVTLTAASTKTVTVSYTMANSTATASIDYVAVAGNLSFAPGITLQTISVVINGDTTIEPDETFRVILSNAVNATIADNQGLGTITNDD